MFVFGSFGVVPVAWKSIPFVAAVAVVLHENEIPNLHVTAAVARKLASLVAQVGAFRTHVIVNLTARTARSCIAHLPKIVFHAQSLDAIRRDSFSNPEVISVVIAGNDRIVFRARPCADKNGDVQLVFVDAKPFGRSDQFPGVGDGFLLEIIAKGKIAEHLEKRVVPLRKSHIFQVVVLPARAHAFLRRGRPRVIPLFQPQKHVLELVHPRIRKQQGSVPMRHQRRAPHPPVPLAIGALLALKKLQKLLAYLVARHFYCVPFPGTSAPVLQDSIPRLSQTQQPPAMKPESGLRPFSDSSTHSPLEREQVLIAIAQRVVFYLSPSQLGYYAADMRRKRLLKLVLSIFILS